MRRLILAGDTVIGGAVNVTIAVPDWLPAAEAVIVTFEEDGITVGAV